MKKDYTSAAPNHQVTPPTRTSAGRSVLLAGATGLVGTELLEQLQADQSVARIVVIGRRPMAASDPRIQSHVVDFDHLESHGDLFAVDQIFCALGTTMRDAGSKEAFRRVDLEYPLAMARLGRTHGARHYLLVSALGADVESRVFYNRVKGELENALRPLGYRSVTIVRPSLLVGKREKFRLFEQLGMIVGELVPGRFRPVRAVDVAGALVAAARKGEPGFRIIESEQIKSMAS